MNFDSRLATDSIFQSKAIPIIPHSFTQPGVGKENYKYIDWSDLLSYKHPLHQSANPNKKLFIEQHRSIIPSLTPVPHQKINEYKNPDFLLSIVLFLLLLYAALNTLFSKYLRQFYYATFIYSESARLYKDQNATLPTFYAWLNIIAVIIFSVDLYLVFRHFGIFSNLSSLSLFLLSFLYILGFYLVKSILINIIGWIIGRQDIFREYLFHYLLYLKFTALLILPVIFFAIFSNIIWTEYALFFTGILLVIAHLFLYVRATKIIIKKGVFIFYWILYLCTAEFIPFLLLYKYLDKGV
ncbi:MAG: DUF4271 domain-containing protein [Bacteroidales bacterium]|nr:DUF4271 domain-containing protein [Bacteroidales bacterium]